MSDGLGPRQRLLAWLQDRAPWAHTFLTQDSPLFAVLRGGAGVALFALVAVALLWGGTGQSLGDAPVVVIETGSMMDCEQGVGTRTVLCEPTSFGSIGAIDPGDLVFVRDTDGKNDVTTMADEGRNRYGQPGDAVVYRPGGRADLTPVIHRAMFWIEFNGDGTFSVPELGLERETNLDHPAIMDRERFGLEGFCQLRFGDNPQSGWITKGDNNRCWDQTGSHSISPGPVQPDWLLGKARGEVPWVGLLKLFVFDLISGTDNYANAPGQLKGFMWFTVAAVIVVPWGAEKGVDYYRARRESQ